VIRVDRGEGLIRLTAAKGPAALPPIRLEASGLLAWIGNPRRPRNDQ